MPYRAVACRAARLLAACFVLLGTVAGPAGVASAASTMTAASYVRLANLSPGEPMFDIYLYPVGNSQAALMLSGIGYGMVTGYQAVPAGSYTVAMRKASNPASSLPVLSTTITVQAGQAYTIASVGPSTGPRLELLNDMLTTPKGKALVRVIQASLGEGPVTVTAGGHPLVHGLAFGSATSYATVSPGNWKLWASDGSMTATDQDTWTAGSSYTLVVLNGTGRLELVCLTDGAGSKVQPSGGASMGFGGMARPVQPELPWAAALAGGVLLMSGGALWLRRTGAPWPRRIGPGV